jgi:Flp pilus assembly pilin Flp
MQILRQIVEDEGGIASVEYALLAAFIGGGIIVAIDALGDVVEWRLSKMADCIESQDPDGVSCS